MRRITNQDGRILEPERYKLPPSEDWYIMFEAATGSVVDDGYKRPLVYDTSKQHPIYVVDFDLLIAIPLTRH